MTVSIVITSFNYARFVGETIESALAQEYEPIEVVVVDDGSTDGSRELIERYRGAVVPIFTENRGQASALNSGFAASSGDVVIFVDSDDVLLPDCARTAVAAFRPGVAKVHWPMLEIDAAGRRTGATWPAHPLRDGDLLPAFLADGLEEHDWPPTSGNAWSRAYLEQVLPIPAEPFRTCPDIYLAGLARLYGTIGAVEKPLSLYRIHGGNNLNAVAFEELLERIDLVYETARERLSRRGIAADISAWRARSWPHRVAQLRRELGALVPPSESLVLIDQEELRELLGHDRRTIPFPEDHGEYAGLPADDAEACSEFERLRSQGERFVAVTWPAFWWLDHYEGLAEILRSQCRCLHRDDQLLLYELHPW